MGTRTILALAAALAVVWVAPAQAANRSCDLTRVASLNLVITPGARGIFLPVTLNDQRKLLLVDTGGVFSTLTPDIVRELSLPTRPSEMRLVNLAGQVMTEVAVVERFGFADARPGPMEFLLHPAEDRTGRFSGDQAGTIAPNILRNYDVEIDFAASKLNLFRHASCANPVYWTTGNATAVKMDVTSEGHIVFPVELDGRPLLAGLDTGMSFTALDLGIARRDFRVDTNAHDVEPLGNLTDGHHGRVYRRQFKSLSTGNGQIRVTNPRIMLLPNVVSFGREPEGRRRPEMIMGLSVLKDLRVYIAYHNETVFFTPASGPPAAEPLPEEENPNSLRSAPGRTRS
jgi:hypothetical protein